MPYPDISLSFLNSLEPIPDDADRYPVTLLERNIHGKLRKMQGESMQIQIPAKGARYLMDIAYAMRMERERNCDYAANVITLPASFFGIHVPLHVRATVTVKQSGLAVINISSVGGTWTRSFWPDMCEINEICFEEPSCLTPDPAEIGNIRLSVYSLRNPGMRNGGASSMSVPVLDADNCEMITSGVIRWNGVDPARDGRLGSEGYMIDSGNNKGAATKVLRIAVAGSPLSTSWLTDLQQVRFHRFAGRRQISFHPTGNSFSEPWLISRYPSKTSNHAAGVTTRTGISHRLKPKGV